MSIIMEPGASDYQIRNVVKKMKTYGVDVLKVKGKYQTFLGAIGDESRLDFDALSAMDGVERTNPVQIDVKYPLVNRRFKNDDTIVEIGDGKTNKVYIGGEKPVYIAGPCSVESLEQMREVAGYVANLAAKDNYGQYMLRGGVWKPRTNPHTFQGLGEEGLNILARIRDEFGLPVVTEGMREEHMQKIADSADAIQIGARHMQAYDLLKAAGKTGKPVIFKKGTDHSVEEFLQASEYILVGGNGKGQSGIVFCPRGSHTKDVKYIRNRPDTEALLVLSAETYFPAIFDPSHSIGRREYVGNVSAAAMAMGAHGLLIEVHPDPQKAMTDAMQQVTPGEFKQIVNACNGIHKMRREYDILR
ncbi:MAG: 3-deoxy-7-phosphoheptulonate synthase [Candidatus Micrarchaeota archaeon]|nr:3-deoxy-7-phosphoheptulonate synthase [Candidatus Micrarchaeota archaeon]